MSKTKVVHILHSVGGVEVYLRLLSENINTKYFANVIVRDTNEHQEYKNASGEKIKEYRIPIQREINLQKDFSAILRTRRILKKEKPDIIHAHSAKGGIIARSAALFLGIKVLHTPHAYSFLSPDGKFKKKFFLGIERLFKYFNSILLATSASEQKRGIHEVGYKPQNALLFNNSIKPIEKIEPLSIEKTWPDNYICSVGRPSYQKNIEMMVEVLKELKKEKPKIHLVLMGVGFYSPNLVAVKKLINKYALQNNITLLEWTQRKDIFNIIKHSKLYLSTARYEGLPYSIIEALALKKACVVTDADGNRDLIKNEENGFVIFDENIECFKNKVLYLLQNDSLLTEFENNSFTKFNANFNIENTLHSLETIYLKNALKK